MNNVVIGQTIYSWAKDIFNYNRSITGIGVRKTLKYLKKKVPELKIRSVKSGIKVFDWTIPSEWKVSEGYIADLDGKKIIDFKKNILHVLGYSQPVNLILSFKELNKHLYSIPSKPTAIPYRTSYYRRNWGFCLSHNQRKAFKKNKKYKVYIKSKLFSGVLNYGEIYFKGKSKKEIFFSCNICHPNLANNEISSPVVMTALAKYLRNKKLKYSYRFIFVPETIGAIAFLKKNYFKIKKKVIAGFTLSCLGDNKSYSLILSREGNNYADKLAKVNYKKNNIKFKEYSYILRGSDERQYCSPKIDLPVCSILRTKYGSYHQYHTSLDNLNYISPLGLGNSFKLLKSLVETAEKNELYVATKKCEPQLIKYNLRDSIGGDYYSNKARIVSHLLAYSDGKNDLQDIVNKLKLQNINTNLKEIKKVSKSLLKKGLLE